jgi:hypothetical protein
MHEEVMEVSDRICNEWEIDFLEGIARRAQQERLTEKQLAILERIYRKACESPY